MEYSDPRVAEVAKLLRDRLASSDNRSDVMRAPELRSLYAEVGKSEPDQRAELGRQINQLKAELEGLANAEGVLATSQTPIDVTAPFDINTPTDEHPRLLDSEEGSRHPLMSELEYILDIFYRMGFMVVESPEIDDDYHMFGSLNFPEGHPARDDYDTFVTVQTDTSGRQLIAPAHTSTMQNRILKRYRENLDKGGSIAVVIPGRVFRNEDLDPRHEHTFYQLEGVYVGKGIGANMLIATLKEFMQAYYQRDLKIKTQPFYFPFTEPSFEFAAECIFCEQRGCPVCSHTGWIELLGCGMIHPNVLKEAGIDPTIYTGFAWGGGIERPVMIKYGIEDIRYFESAKLDFLRQFA
ncbi:MAG TPA: phenylalanine--tRNA ligase subunit alpha [Candidatus Saccharimonadales bacterium]|nr:phenylalanine--tRNA ligase subunit alpha [Candidatus Saccharimonadales bacterium]